MNKIIKWGLAAICMVSMANFTCFLSNKSIFMSKVESFTEGWDDLFPWCPWMSDFGNQSGPTNAGPSVQPSPYQNVSADFTITCNQSNSSSVTEGVTKSHTFEVGASWKILTGKANKTGSHSNTQSNGSSQTQIESITYHYAPTGTVYDVKCVSPELVYSCEEKYGWRDGFCDFVDNVVTPIRNRYGM